MPTGADEGEYWTPERMASAVPREQRVDPPSGDDEREHDDERSPTGTDGPGADPER